MRRRQPGSGREGRPTRGKLLADRFVQGVRGTGEDGEVSGSRGSRSERLLAARSLAPPRLLLTPAEVATATPVLWGLWRQQGSERPRLARRVSLTALSLNCLHVAIVPHLLFDPLP